MFTSDLLPSVLVTEGGVRCPILPLTRDFLGCLATLRWRELLSSAVGLVRALIFDIKGPNGSSLTFAKARSSLRRLFFRDVLTPGVCRVDFRDVSKGRWAVPRTLSLCA